MSTHSAQIRQERVAGLLLIAAAGAALVLANGPWADAYHHALEARIGPVMPRRGVMSIHQWVADALMATRGAIRTSIDPTMNKPIVLRATGGPSILQELSNERVAVTIEDALRINASAMAVQMFIGSENETQSLRNLTKLVDEGLRYGVPVIGVVAVGKEMARDARYFRLACRIGAELGAQIIKVYYTDEEFASVVSTCPVPIVVAGGKKVGELEALTMAERSIAEGAAGVDMGRNIFQSESPVAMIQAVRAVVHQGQSAADAFALFTELSN